MVMYYVHILEGMYCGWCETMCSDALLICL